MDLKKLTSLCGSYTSENSKVLYELERETNLKTLSPQMLCGHLQGRFLSMLSRLKRPASILEIGTFTGYATICLAEGLALGGIVNTIEVNPEYEYLCRKYFEMAGFQKCIRSHVGDAQQVIQELDEDFDIVFIDAGKRDNGTYFDLVIDKTRPGGFIIVDNVLWSGKIAAEANDVDTSSIRDFLERISNDPRVDTLLLPLRDGLLIAEKKPLQQLSQSGS